MTPKPPTDPKPITPARLAKLRKADSEMVEALEAFVSKRLANIAAERAMLLKLRRFLEQPGEPS